MGFSLRHLLGTALHDIPLVSDAVQAAQGGKVQYGPDLVHAKPWMPPAGMNPAQHAQLRSILGTTEQRRDFKPIAPMQKRPMMPLNGHPMVNPNPQTMNTEYPGPYRGVAPTDTDEQLGAFQLQPQMQQHLNPMQPTSWNNGQVSLNGGFNQGNATGPGLELSPYNNLNNRKIRF